MEPALTCAPQLALDSVWASLGSSVGFTLVIAVAFSLLRPYNSVVYAPKLKHADEAHAPPPMGKGMFAWFNPVVKTKENDLIRHLGLDATVFLRFTRMCRNIFLTLTVLGVGILIPVNVLCGISEAFDNISPLARITPINTFDQPNWAQVVVAYAFDLIICGYLYYNYRKVTELRRDYFNSPEYMGSLHARTLMINDIPKSYRTDEGIGRLIDEVVPTSSFSRTAIARNVKDLPKLIAEHEHTVRKLEKFLAKYLKNPDNLPPTRPTCYPSKNDPSYGSYVKSQKVDAIEYLSGRIKSLEVEIKDVRMSLDKRNALPYGFASYEEIAEAHSIAYTCRKKHPQGTAVVLAPRPNDVIWQNMPLGPKERRWKLIINFLWVTLLTLVWIAPNAMIAIFIVNLANLGLVWPAFQSSLASNRRVWALVQGIASPAITSLIYLVLPIIFRRLAMKAGDRTKTGRERHVTGKLYTFFVFNNLVVFCVFSTFWGFIGGVIKDTQGDNAKSAWQAIHDQNIALTLHSALCDISPFWITWLLQRNLGAAADLAQLWTLLWSSCVRKFSSPTPRELIELTAPPAFDYAAYYNYFLFYSTVALAFATIQPLVLPAAALYFLIDAYLKKYLLLYIFITKTESGGMFWRVLFNRMVFATMFANCVVFLSVWVRGDTQWHHQAFCVIPLPFLMLAFKFYCRRKFDAKTHYYTTTNVVRDEEGAGKSRKSDRLASRYGHPALYKPLMTPMVHARAQSILASIYRGRLTDSNNPDHNDFVSVSGYSDTYALDTMKAGAPGKSANAKLSGNLVPGFEMVDESKLDFAYYKDRAEFGEDHGGGDIYGMTPNPFDRSGAETADTFKFTKYSGSEAGSRSGSPVPNVHEIPGAHRIRGTNYSSGVGHTYPAGYAAPAYDDTADMGLRNYATNNSHIPRASTEALVPNAQGVPVSMTPSPYAHEGNDYVGSTVAPGSLGGGPQGYGNLPQEDVERERERQREDEARRRMNDPMDYDYYRSVSRRNNGGWQGWTG